MNPVCQALIDRGVVVVYYMARTAAMASIVDQGIMSYTALQRGKIAPVSLANTGVQARRGKKRIVGMELHEFVPFYFATHTPMQCEVEHRDGFDPDDLVLADVSVRLLGEQSRLIYFSDENAACTTAKFSDDPAGLSEIDWHIVWNVKKCFSPDYKACKAAELLVYPKVPATCITRLTCRSNRAWQLMLRLLKKPHPPAVIDGTRFFK